MKSGEKEQNVTELQSAKNNPQIVDYKVTMLIAAGAAMAANCEPCLNRVVPDLIEAGVAEADIRKAVEENNMTIIPKPLAETAIVVYPGNNSVI